MNVSFRSYTILANAGSRAAVISEKLRKDTGLSFSIENGAVILYGVYRPEDIAQYKIKAQQIYTQPERLAASFSNAKSVAQKVAEFCGLPGREVGGCPICVAA